MKPRVYVETSVEKAKVELPLFTCKAPDAIIAEVWRIKAQWNAEAGDSVDKIIKHARHWAVQQLTGH